MHIDFCRKLCYINNSHLPTVQEVSMSSSGEDEVLVSEETSGELVAKIKDDSAYYEVDVSCPELTISGDSEYLDADSVSGGVELSCTLDLNSNSSSDSIDIGTQCDLSILDTSVLNSSGVNIGTQSELSIISPSKDTSCHTGTKRPQLEISPELDYKYKRMKFSRDRVKARPPLRVRKRRESTQGKPTKDYILSVSPDKRDLATLRGTSNMTLHDHTCTIQ